MKNNSNEIFLEYYGEKQKVMGLEKAMKLLGDKIKNLCRSKHITTKDLAKEIGFSYPYLMRILRGELPANIDLLVKISKALKVDILDLIKLLFVKDYTDSEGHPYMLEIILYKASDRKRAELDFIGEKDLIYSFQCEEYCNIDFKKDDFITQLAKYRFEKLYQTKINELLAIIYKETRAMANMNPQKTDNILLKSIVEMLQDLDDEKLGYIKASIATYLEYHVSK